MGTRQTDQRKTDMSRAESVILYQIGTITKQVKTKKNALNFSSVIIFLNALKKNNKNQFFLKLL